MKNPFTIGIVSAEAFCNRETERKELIDHAKNSSNVLLCSPRRYGKSSLVSLVLEDLKKKGFLTAYVDLFPISSEEDFVARFATAVLRGIGFGVSQKSFFERIKGFFSVIRPVIEVTEEGYSVSIKYDGKDKNNLALDDLMEGLHKYVKKKGVQACIVLDEFQEITELTNAKKIEGTLRSHIQHQKNISYFYVGSRRRILQDMFHNKSRPFYKSAYTYILEPISSEHFVPFISKRFKDTGKDCSVEIANMIYEHAKGYPYYVQKFSAVVWDATERKCSVDIVKKAFERFLRSESIDFEGVWSSLTLTQKSLMHALAIEETSMPYAKDFLEKHGLSIGGAQKSLKALLAKDLVEKSPENIFRLTDPIMKTWLES